MQEEGSLAPVEACLNEVLSEVPCLTVKDLAITGQDILSLGIAPGPQIGECMRHLLRQVQNELLPNEKKALMQAADEYFEKNQ